MAVNLVEPRTFTIPQNLVPATGSAPAPAETIGAPLSVAPPTPRIVIGRVTVTEAPSESISVDITP